MPVPVAVPAPYYAKNLEVAKSFGFGINGPSVDVNVNGVNPVQGIFAGAQKVLNAAGGLPILSTLSNGVGASLNKQFYVGNNAAPVAAAVATPAAAPVPVYRFVTHKLIAIIDQRE